MRRDLRVDIDPNALDLGVFAHGVKTHFTAVARHARTTKW